VTEIIALARCQYGAAKDQEVTAAEWDKILSEFPERVRRHAANMAAHSHDITLVDGRRLLISCAWYNTLGHTFGTGFFYKDGGWTTISTGQYDRLYPLKQKQASSDGTRAPAREYTINTECLK
jgi:hypothetical protein